MHHEDQRGKRIALQRTGRVTVGQVVDGPQHAAARAVDTGQGEERDTVG